MAAWIVWTDVNAGTNSSSYQLLGQKEVKKLGSDTLGNSCYVHSFRGDQQHTVNSNTLLTSTHCQQQHTVNIDTVNINTLSTSRPLFLRGFAGITHRPRPDQLQAIPCAHTYIRHRQARRHALTQHKHTHTQHTNAHTQTDTHAHTHARTH